MKAQEIAQRLKESSVWEMSDCVALCECAGMLNDFMNADGDSFEAVVMDAAYKLGVEII